MSTSSSWAATPVWVAIRRSSLIGRPRTAIAQQPSGAHFVTELPDLSLYHKIWALGYNSTNKGDSTNILFMKPVENAEPLVLARFMQDGSGVLITGGHDGLEIYICGRILRTFDYSMVGSVLQTRLTTPPAVEASPSPFLVCPVTIILCPGWKFRGSWTNPQTTCTRAKRLVWRCWHISVVDSQPRADVQLGKFKEHRTKGEHRETPMIIVMGSIIDGHATKVEPSEFCEGGFMPNDSMTRSEDSTPLLVCDGFKAGIGCVLVDWSFHHFLDLNLINDPCAKADKRREFGTRFLNNMDLLFINSVMWPAPRRYWNL
ncbi:hypothetical protein AOQ84DRAFT_362447 [Glonium stellatum]|uniref:Uncharacterized protein n=1 Tax=Glonium stellatum TaxID=574774 RepID=A0A8E2JUT4_9PEZI|nr:hypothetical protein AOQ84DRAFT_362447 [Glonium stellatum]